MTTRKRSWWPVWVGLGLLAALAVLLFLRAKAPPEAARLLPESDAIVFANLRPLRSLAHWDELSTATADGHCAGTRPGQRSLRPASHAGPTGPQWRGRLLRGADRPLRCGAPAALPDEP